MDLEASARQELFDFVQINKTLVNTLNNLLGGFEEAEQENRAQWLNMRSSYLKILDKLRQDRFPAFPQIARSAEFEIPENEIAYLRFSIDQLRIAIDALQEALSLSSRCSVSILEALGPLKDRA